MAVTALYVSYMVGVVSSLLFFGRLSDQFGRIAVLKVALFVLSTALLCSAAAPSLAMLMAARTIIGFGSGLLTSTATAAIVDLHPEGNQPSASLVASIATIVGLGSGPLLGGVVAQALPWPLVMPYLVSASLIAICLLLIKTLAPAEAGSSTGHLSFSPQLRLPKPVDREAFLTAGFVGFCGFAIIGLLASLAPSFLRTVIGWQGPAAAGAVVTLAFVVSGVMQIVGRRQEARRALSAGSLMMAVGLLLLAAATSVRSGSLFLLSELVAGGGQGLTFMAALATVNRLMEAWHRAASLATFLVIVYLGGLLPVLGLGALASWMGLSEAVTIFCLVLAMACLVTLPLSKSVQAQLNSTSI